MKRKQMALAAVIATTVIAAGCGSGGSNDNSGSEEVGSLVLGVPGPTTSAAPFVLAQEAGLYEKNGVKIEIQDKGALAPAQVAAGRIDLAQYGTGAAFAPAASGRDMSVVYALSGNSTGGVMIAADSSMKSQGSAADTLLQLSGKRVGVQGQGGSSYGNANAISKNIVDHGGKALKLVPLKDYGAMQAQLVNGQLDAAVIFANPFLKAIDQNKLRVLVPSDDPELAKIEGGTFGALSVFGLSSNLEKNKPAVTAFIKSIQEAYDMMEADDLTKTAEMLHKNPLFSSLPVDNLVAQMKLDKPFWRPNNGEITPESWKVTLDAIGSWGLPQDLAKDTFSFGNIVDMTYYKDAEQ